MLWPQYCVSKKKKEQRRKANVFCFSDESEAGPVIQYKMTFGDNILFVLCF